MGSWGRSRGALEVVWGICEVNLRVLVECALDAHDSTKCVVGAGYSLSLSTN